VAIGPLVGGALTDALGWQWIFFVNVPIGIAAIALTLAKLGESRIPDAEPVDWIGVATFSASLFLFVFSLVRGNSEGWSSLQITGSLIGSLILMLAFVAVELRSDHPMLELGLFRKPAFVGVSAVVFCLSAGMFAMFLYITIYIQDILGYSPLQAGVRFLPLTLTSFFAAPMAARFLNRVPARFFFAIGLTLVAVGLFVMGGISDGSGWTTLLVGLLVSGVGIGIANPAIATIAVGVVPAAKAGMGSGINTTFRQAGIATGIAALGAIFQHGIETRLADQLSGSPSGLGEAVASSGTRAVSGQGGDAVAAARDAFIGSLNELFLIAGAIAVVGAALGLLLTRERDLVPHGVEEGETVAEPVAS